MLRRVLRHGFSKEEWRRHLSPWTGMGIPAGLMTYKEMPRIRRRPARRLPVLPSVAGDQFNLATRLADTPASCLMPGTTFKS